MKFEFTIGARAVLVSDVASVAARVERQMAAAFFRYIFSDGVAAEAKVALLVPGGRLEQLELIIRTMRVVALEAVANRWRVHRTLDIGGVLVRVAAETEIQRRGGSQLDARHIFVDPNLVTTGTPQLDRRVDGLPF